MDEILHDLSPASIATAIDENLCAMVATFGRGAQVEMHDGSDLLWVDPSRPFPPMKGIFRTQLAVSDVHARIEAAVSAFRDLNRSMGWWIGPTTRPADLGAHLAAYGFSHVRDTPGMAIDPEVTRYIWHGLKGPDVLRVGYETTSPRAIKKAKRLGWLR